MIGSEMTGKTSLVRRYVDNTFDENYKVTIGVNISKKEISSKGLKLMIWDIEGGMKAFNRPLNYFLGASFGIAVVDAMRTETWDDAISIHKHFSHHNPQSSCVVAINKMDVVSSEDKLVIRKLANEKFGSVFDACYFTSALDGQEVSALFESAFLND